jgi:hypothetical protein
MVHGFIAEHRIVRKYFFRLLYLGLFTVCIPLMLSSILFYWLISSNVEHQINSTNQEMLAQFQQRIDERLIETEQAMVSLLFDNDTLRAVYQSDVGQDNVALLELSRKLSLVKQSIPKAYSVDLYLPQQHVLLSSALGYLSINDIGTMDLFYRSLNLSQSSVWEYSRHPEKLTNGKEESYITYVNQLPIFSATPNGYVSVSFKVSDFFQILNPLNSSNGETMVVNSNSEIIFHSDTVAKQHFRKPCQQRFFCRP